MHGSTKLSSSMLDRCSHLEPPGPESAFAVMFVCNFTAERFHSYAPNSWLAMLNRVCMT